MMSRKILSDHVLSQLQDDRLRDMWRDVTDSGFVIPEEYVSESGVPTLIEVTSEKNCKIRKLVSKCFPDEETAAIMTVPCHDKSSVLKRVEFSWMFCYGADNTFEFREGVTWLRGRNSAGKTAFQEIIILGLFGSGIPSRTSDSSGHDFANYRRPDGCKPAVCLTIETSGRTYAIQRTWSDTAGKRGALVMSSCIKDVTDPQSPVLVCKTTTAAKDWVTKHVGTKENFLRCAVMTQYNDGDFFELDGSKQLDLLMDDVDDLDIADKNTSQMYVDILKQLGSSVTTLIKCVQASKDAISAVIPKSLYVKDVNSLREERAVLDAAIEEMRFDLKEKRDLWQGRFRALGLRDMPSIETITENINKISGKRKLDEKVVPDLSHYKMELEELECKWGSNPYNPQCAACRGQPWRVQMRKLKSLLEGTKKGLGTDELLDEEKLQRWKELLDARSDYEDFTELHEKFKDLKSKEADITVMIERTKVKEENVQRLSVLEKVLFNLQELSNVVVSARNIVLGYRCWVLENRILPEFVTNMNCALNCFPGNQMDVSVTTLSDSSAAFSPVWKITRGNVSLSRAGGFERALVNCAARISLGRMFHSDRKQYVQLLIDESLVSCDETNAKFIPTFLDNIVGLGYSHILYNCHFAPFDHCEIGTDGFGNSRLS